jgi:hypothetical protein
MFRWFAVCLLLVASTVTLMVFIAQYTGLRAGTTPPPAPADNRGARNDEDHAERHAGGLDPAGATDFSEPLRHIDSVRCGPHRTCGRASRRATTWLGS